MQTLLNKKQLTLKNKWTYKVVPFAGWIGVALFHRFGIARDRLKDKLPLLKDGDYSKEEKRMAEEAGIMCINRWFLENSMEGGPFRWRAATEQLELDL